MKARLLAGRSTAPAQGESGLFAFVQIALEPGWKTYWRSPGDAGGLPPSFDWSKSTNLAKADVRFPAPRRFTDKAGNTIGYENELVLPIALTAEDPSRPVTLAVEIHYGICKDVCIPVDAELTLEVAPEPDEEPLPSEAVAALEALPRAQDNLRPDDPALIRAESVLDGASPKLTIEARVPGGREGADAFIEAPGGLYLPLPSLVAEEQGDTLRFEADLSKDVDLAALKGQPVTLTLVGAKGSSVATFVVE